MVRKPPGFQQWKLNGGMVRLQVREDGTWVILAHPPDLKLDNAHMDRRPHVHVGGWDSDDRRALRPDLEPHEARETLARLLNEDGYVDVKRLLEELS